MKSIYFIIPLLLTGCTALPNMGTYKGQENDPIVHVQSLVDMRGTIPRHSKTSFHAIYSDEQNECHSMNLKDLGKPYTPAELRAEMLNKQGVM